MSNSPEQVIAKIFTDIAEGLETGSFGRRPQIAVTGLGSEHGEKEVFSAALEAARRGNAVTYIGTLKDARVTTISAADAEDAHKKMDELLNEGKADGAVTMHYPFPIGVSTVGRIITPAGGKEIFIASTTGTSSTDRTEAMVKNAILGIITAKACGIEHPTIGILNVDGARQTEAALKQLKEGGYDIEFAESSRSDGGCIMRGNDLLAASCNIMVTDSLTGNILVKMLSAYSTGGNYESVGFGYGPGIGEGYDKLVLIVSRASGAPVIANAIGFGAELTANHYKEIAAAEFAAAKKAGLDEILKKRKTANKSDAAVEEAAAAPPKEVVTHSFAGIEVMDLDDAVHKLWKSGIYAESGMGCTGPIVLVSEENAGRAEEILKQGGWIG